MVARNRGAQRVGTRVILAMEDAVPTPESIRNRLMCGEFATAKRSESIPFLLPERCTEGSGMHACAQPRRAAEVLDGPKEVTSKKIKACSGKPKLAMQK